MAVQNAQERFMENQFEIHFRKGMINKDFNRFKRTHPTLLKVVINAMVAIDNKNRKP